jgi:hypothetical protein
MIGGHRVNSMGEGAIFLPFSDVIIANELKSSIDNPFAWLLPFSSDLIHEPPFLVQS